MVRSLEMLQHSNHVNTCMLATMQSFTTYHYVFYEIYGKIKKVTKYQRELCALLLQIETIFQC